jgi:hypothetical protein
LKGKKYPKTFGPSLYFQSVVFTAQKLILPDWIFGHASNLKTGGSPGQAPELTCFLYGFLHSQKPQSLNGPTLAVYDVYKAEIR